MRTFQLVVVALVLAVVYSVPVPQEAAKDVANVVLPVANPSRLQRALKPNLNNTRNTTRTPEELAAYIKSRRSNDVRRTMPGGGPFDVYKDAIAIVLRWAHDAYDGYDLDSVLLDPNGCITAPKGAYPVTNGCINYFSNDDGYYTTMFGPDTMMGSTCVPGNCGFNTADGYDGSEHAGLEFIIVHKPDIAGTFKHLVYQASSWADNGFLTLSDARVDIYERNDNNLAEAFHSYDVQDASGWGFCSGRFWNTFTVSLSGDYTADDDDLSYISPTSVQTLTKTPYTFIGSTSTQPFESQDRTYSTYCSDYSS